MLNCKASRQQRQNVEPAICRNRLLLKTGVSTLASAIVLAGSAPVLAQSLTGGTSGPISANPITRGGGNDIAISGRVNPVIVQPRNGTPIIRGDGNNISIKSRVNPDILRQPNIRVTRPDPISVQNIRNNPVLRVENQVQDNMVQLQTGPAASVGRSVIDQAPRDIAIRGGASPARDVIGADDIAINGRAELTVENQPQAVGPRFTNSQTIQATPTFVSGGGTYDAAVAFIPDPSVVAAVIPIATVDQITVTGAETIINWSPFDTGLFSDTPDAINILPSSTALQFGGPSGGYTVLNRILPAVDANGDVRAVNFGGIVNSFLGTSTDGAGLFNGPVGGNIFFYSPGGIIRWFSCSDGQ